MLYVHDTTYTYHDDCIILLILNNLTGMRPILTIGINKLQYIVSPAFDNEII